MQYTLILLTTICLPHIIGSYFSDHDEEIDEIGKLELSTYQELIENGTQIVEADPVFKRIQKLIDSKDVSFQNTAKETMQNFMSQLKDKGKRYAQITLHGTNYLVHMGAAGTALRAKNEAMAWQLWNYLVNLVHKILCFIFSIGSCKKSASTFAFADDDEFCIEDAIVMKTALEQQLREVMTVLNEKYVLFQDVEYSNLGHNIHTNTIEKLEKDNEDEEIYKNNLMTAISELEGSIRATEVKVAQIEAKKIADENVKQEEQQEHLEEHNKDSHVNES